MKIPLALAVGGTAAATLALAAHGDDGPASATLVPLPRPAAAGQTALWGHAKSLARVGGRWRLRFDPALLLRGTAAEQAAFEDTGSRQVANDAYVLEESHRLLTYVVRDDARATVLTKGLRATTVPVAELAQILRGKNPRHRALFVPGNALGFWITVGTTYPNPVVRLDQQYQP